MLDNHPTITRIKEITHAYSDRPEIEKDIKEAVSLALGMIEELIAIAETRARRAPREVHQ